MAIEPPHPGEPYHQDSWTAGWTRGQNGEQGRGLPDPPRPARPRVVTAALVCWVLTAISTIVYLIVTLNSRFWQRVLDQAAGDGAANGISASQVSDTVSLVKAGAIAVAAISVSLYLYFAVMMHVGRTWARTVLTVLAALTVLTWLTSGGVSTNVTVNNRVFHTAAASPWITGVFAIVGLVLMYLPASNAYFSAARRRKAWMVSQGR